MAEADLLRVRLEEERLLIAANTARLEADRARIQLFREMGQTEFPEVLFEPIEGAASAPMGVDAEKALEERVEMQIARHAVEQGRAALRVQQSLAKPNVEALFGFKRTAGLDTMLGGVQVDLPLRNRNQGSIAGAEAEVRVAEASLAATAALIQAEVKAAASEYEIRRGQTGDFLRSMRDKALEAARIAEAAYREGGTDLLRLLDAQRLRIDTQVLYYRALAEYRQSVAALESAMGVAP
jgi:outer membrane protein TolC